MRHAPCGQSAGGKQSWPENAKKSFYRSEKAPRWTKTCRSKIWKGVRDNQRKIIRNV